MYSKYEIHRYFIGENKRMITTYSAYIQRLDIESLKKYVPEGESFYAVTLKEILDNSLDAAEKSDNTVIIDYIEDNGTDYISISNKGEIPKQVIKDMSRFDNNTSEKFKQFSYRRGQIGQGLKLAIAMATVDTNYFCIETGKNKYEISIIDRNPKKPSNAVNIKTSSRDKNYDNTIITFACPSVEESEEIIKRYKIANPHINFICGEGHEYNFKQTIILKKNLKNDISKYNADDINKLTDFYKLTDIIDSFDIPEYRKNKITHASGILSYAKPIKPLIFGQKALQDRLEQVYVYGEVNILSYKKIDTDNGVLELAVLDKDNIKIVAVNGSIVDEHRLSILEENNPKIKSGLIMSFDSFLSDIKFKKGFLCLYHNSRPDYRDANKQAILINSTDKEFNRIKNFLKTFNKRTERDNWHLCDSKDELTEKIVSIANEMYLSMNLPITIRQLYYQLVSRGVIVNGKYNTLDAYLTQLRKTGILDWQLFEDRNRYFHKIDTIEPKTDIKDLISAYIANLELPPIDKWHNQPFYIELWYEKDALSSYFQYIADKWHILCFANRGYNSFTMNKETQNRFAKYKNKHIVVLYCGDYDPHGFGIYENLKKVLNIKIERIALSQEQIKQYNLIEMPELKGSDKIKNDFTGKYGDKAYELDALPTKELMRLLDSSIAKYFNPDLYDSYSIDKENQAILEKIKKNIINSLK